MGSPLKTFAGLLDRSVQQIATLAADARTFDASRIGSIADMWDNNAFPLVSAACAPWPLRAGRSRTGLLWMADLGAARRELLVDLDPTFDPVLPAPRPERFVHRDFEERVFPGEFPLTAEVVAALVADYDLADASVRSFTARPARTGLQARLTLAAPRRFVPSAEYVASDGSGKPWPAAPLNFSFADVTDLRYDAEDRIGVSVTCADAGPTVAIGRGGRLRAASVSVWPNDPRWYESAAGRAADQVVPYARPERRKPVRTSCLTAEQTAAARAIQHLMIQIRLVHYYPELAARVPVDEICRLAAGAGRAILAAAARRGSARAKAFAELAQRWCRVPGDRDPTPIPSGPTLLRFVSYQEPHTDYDVHRDGSAVVIAAVPDADPAAPWRLTSDIIAGPARFRITSAAFDGAQHIHRDTGAMTIGDSLAVQP